MVKQWDNPDPKKTKVKKFLLRGILIVLAILLILFIGSGVYFFIRPTPILNINQSIGIRAVYTGETETQESSTVWCGGVEEAINHNEILADSCYISDSLIEKDTAREYNGVYFIQTGGNYRSIKQFVVLHLQKNEDKIESVPEWYSCAYVNLDEIFADGSKKYTYQEEDTKVAGYLTERMGRQLTESDVYYFKYFGVSEDPSVKNLTILGRSPDDIIEYEYEGVTYYFWYYDKHKPDFYQYLLDHPDFDFGDFTLAQMIEVLEIKF